MANITESNYKVYLGKIATHAKAYCTIATYPNSSSQLPSVEALYGIYNSKTTAHITLCNWFGDISDATSSTPCTAIPRGFTVAVEENNTVVEYQYKKEMPSGGYTMDDLEVKSASDANDVTYNPSSTYRNGSIGKALKECVLNSANYYEGILAAMSELGSGEAVAAQVALNTGAIEGSSQIGNTNSSLIESKVNALINCVRLLIECAVFYTGTPFVIPQELYSQLSLYRYPNSGTTPAICGQAICGQTICGTT